MTAEPKIDYEALAQDAMRGVVRDVLLRTAKNGLPGEHHFYISFDTEAPGIILSKRLKAKYPTEMTVVLQHRFWDLNVTDERFEVKLTFDGIPERLVVPFSAIKVFFDPSVRYGLQFDEPDFNAEAVDDTMTSLEHGVTTELRDGELGEFRDEETAPTVSRSSSPRKRRSTRKKSDKRTVDAEADSAHSDASPQDTDHAAGDGSDNDPAEQPADVHKDDEVEEAKKQVGGAEIVSLDAFRKK